mmetsp:Transcript_29292/g.53144  ORF Transcript_29292/g.53144 Transcript_29292/m.53144 type:complete len:246 (+) Transcript_29292:453-1190(+)
MGFGDFMKYSWRSSVQSFAGRQSGVMEVKEALVRASSMAGLWPPFLQRALASTTVNFGGKSSADGAMAMVQMVSESSLLQAEGDMMTYAVGRSFDFSISITSSGLVMVFLSMTMQFAGHESLNTFTIPSMAARFSASFAASASGSISSSSCKPLYSSSNHSSSHSMLIMILGAPKVSRKAWAVASVPGQSCSTSIGIPAVFAYAFRHMVNCSGADKSTVMFFVAANSVSFAAVTGLPPMAISSAC